MHPGFILLGLVGVVLGLLIAYAVKRKAGERDRARRHEQDRIAHFSDEDFTQWGHS